MSDRSSLASLSHGIPEGKAKQRIMVVRHGRTQWNDEGRYQGVSDVELNATGRAQVARLGHEITSAPFASTITRVLTSDLTRARDTAVPIAHGLGLRLVEDPRLREVASGPWEGMLFSDIDREYPELMERWKRGDADAAAGGTGETREEVALRAVASVADNLKTMAAGTTLVVLTHGGTARSLCAAMLGLPHGLWNCFVGLHNCHWNTLEWIEGVGENEPGHWELMELNVNAS